jgi:hypothetical protein
MEVLNFGLSRLTSCAFDFLFLSFSGVPLTHSPLQESPPPLSQPSLSRMHCRSE